ncbi:hypothetical protein [Riemerella anatipestifer]|uniref:Uncharacterized protein n=1 Tax=Riemerella anatipestifer RA-CH-1 TaxID=1228997 RepID=J9R9Q8_RIEAN|nr:hypothetical protein [Riemerella anatipestifer]AFR36162.1 hypothetical protein B739_1570 [Riemerella anatipestifer RA-CH-1]AIH03163.1 hypothetical protein M949_1996 [Riemerella anatipestifer CH3]MCO7332062.1 hypothetical protein [Riemerella anatipestifer]MCO7350949.1 hypothetical protein [Riemerella anatipestifer]MCU7582312.1 hypothetical protein [Riemerella anatipestifer]
MRIIIALVFLLGTSFQVFGQKKHSYLYKGMMDRKTPITMYLQSEDNGCTGELYYMGMYSYGSDRWIQLDINNNDRNQFVLVEEGLTGVLMLQKTKKGFSGLWISPDTKKQLKVELVQEKLQPKEKEVYEQKLENLNYENHDC